MAGFPVRPRKQGRPPLAAVSVPGSVSSLDFGIPGVVAGGKMDGDVCNRRVTNGRRHNYRIH